MATAIVLHGRGHGVALTRALMVERLGLPALEYVVPVSAGDTWYPASFLAPLADNAPDLDAAIARVLGISDALVATGVPLAAQAIVGFSQGACLACEAVFRAGRRLGALVAFTGGLVGPRGTAWAAADGALAGMPVLLGGSREDPFVPAWRMAETAEAMQRRGAHVDFTLFEGAAHVIEEPQVLAARSLLAALG